jgi:hypothetical protein
MLPLAAIAAFGLAACSSSTQGQGTAAPTTNTQQDTGGAGAPSSGSSTGSGGSSLAAVQPCGLLSTAVQTQYELSPAATTPGTGARPCNWNKPVDQNGENGYEVEIDVRDSQGLSSINTNGFTVTPDNVGSHQGRLVQLDAGGTCFVALGVGSGSRVDVSVTAGTDTSQACQVANQLAKVVEPQLPSGS